ncbi:hypothetical protein CUR178_07030 [Leishmania enriettii]|uniref:Uncharacterized protein n=1 Tax=Leishmania enriettii TaxID=5663 RepID=A0A836GGM5_LEIEN|nr:hypothetical protein CUR178_07030 [Leishmania enriettii]
MSCNVGTFATLTGTSHQHPRNTFWIDELEKRWQVAVICVAQRVVASFAGGPKGPPAAASAPTLLMLDAVQRCWRRPAQVAPSQRSGGRLGGMAFSVAVVFAVPVADEVSFPGTRKGRN